MSWIIGDLGSDPPYGPQIEFDDSYFADEESAAAFMQAFQDALSEHSVVSAPNYNMIRSVPNFVQVYPVPTP